MKLKMNKRLRLSRIKDENQKPEQKSTGTVSDTGDVIVSKQDDIVLLSPVACLTQDEELDVIWDWESPRTDKRHLIRKRLIHSSPKTQPKQHTFHCSNTSLTTELNTLTANLEVLVNKINSDDCARINNVDSNINSNVNNNSDTSREEKSNSKSKSIEIVADVEKNDLFKDDSFDEAMFECSQKVEENYVLNQTTNNCFEDDSFNKLLEKINEDEMESLFGSTSQLPIKSNINSNLILSPRSIARQNSVPINFFSKTPQHQSALPRTKSEELPTITKQIEKTNLLKTCSPEEIEQKRAEAKARLEFKSKQNEITKRRLEALERLKRNRTQKMLFSTQQCKSKPTNR